MNLLSLSFKISISLSTIVELYELFSMRKFFFFKTPGYLLFSHHSSFQFFLHRISFVKRLDISLGIIVWSFFKRSWRLLSIRLVMLLLLRVAFRFNYWFFNRFLNVRFICLWLGNSFILNLWKSLVTVINLFNFLK